MGSVKFNDYDRYHSTQHIIHTKVVDYSRNCRMCIVILTENVYAQSYLPHKSACMWSTNESVYGVVRLNGSGIIAYTLTKKKRLFHRCINRTL